MENFQAKRQPKKPAERRLDGRDQWYRTTKPSSKLGNIKENTENGSGIGEQAGNYYMNNNNIDLMTGKSFIKRGVKGLIKPLLTCHIFHDCLGQEGHDCKQNSPMSMSIAL